MLHDDSIRLYTRIGGLFLLLFAQPLTTICLMRTSQVDATDPARILVTFEHTPVEMPEPLARLIGDHLDRRGQASYASKDNGWLFPGGIPGRPLATENIRGQLVARGIQPHSARHAALFALSGQVPHLILAQTLGISQAAATRWAALAARDWGPTSHSAASGASGRASELTCHASSADPGAGEPARSQRAAAARE